MSAKLAPLTPEQRRQIGRAVRAARGNGVSWKVLQRVYGRSRMQLWRCLQVVERDEAGAP